MIAKGVPGKLGNYPVILVQVVTMMAKYQVWLKAFCNRLKEEFDGFSLIRKKAVSKAPDYYLGANCGS
jgi:hypothetical protein